MPQAGNAKKKKKKERIKKVKIWCSYETNGVTTMYVLL